MFHEFQTLQKVNKRMSHGKAWQLITSSEMLNLEKMADDTKKNYTEESEKEIKGETVVEVEPSNELMDEGHQRVELKRVLYSFSGGGLQDHGIVLVSWSMPRQRQSELDVHKNKAK